MKLCLSICPSSCSLFYLCIFFFLLAYRARAHNSIEATRAVDIRAYSASYVEDELLLLPGTILEVMERADRGAGGMAIRLREIESACGLVW